MRLRVAAVLLALAALVGCGGGDGDDGETTTTGDAKRAIEAEDQQRAESIVLQLTDFPPGWRGAANEDPDEGGDCFDVDSSQLTVVGEADSQEFSMGEDSFIESSATVYDTEEAAQRALGTTVGVLTDPAAKDCFKESFSKELANDEGYEEFEVGDTEVGELSFPGPSGVEEARAFQIVLPIKAQGVTFDIFLELVVLRQDDAAASVTTGDLEDPLDTSLRDDLVQVMADRMTPAAATTTQTEPNVEPSAPTQAGSVTPTDTLDPSAGSYGSFEEFCADQPEEIECGGPGDAGP